MSWTGLVGFKRFFVFLVTFLSISAPPRELLSVRIESGIGPLRMCEISRLSQRGQIHGIVPTMRTSSAFPVQTSGEHLGRRSFIHGRQVDSRIVR